MEDLQGFRHPPKGLICGQHIENVAYYPLFTLTQNYFNAAQRTLKNGNILEY
jgi:hypothetical protein